ncbi:MAG: YggS family pyridoxal phosphate-dependent enzyme [Candidatus Electrothrix sp. GW3-4]|uniref:YggS family pyridoxal phosphate-dependent enzyme n=1 Tax=Candidatus Electrothrix sp. GW3-4 TaxID=3126740 RepID=UPI0030D31EAD
MICANLERIRSIIQKTARDCGRDPQEIKLVAVSKRMPAEMIAAAHQCEQMLFGENYLQDAAAKISQLPSSLRWHFIGHLQSNKAKTAAELFQMIETVDRPKIAQALDRQAGFFQKKLDILIQVNVGREPQKSGVLPEDASDLLRAMQPLTNLRVRGLMTMPPYGREAEASRPWFQALKKLSVELAGTNSFYDNKAVELSMGMSGDFKVAIEEGATLVRVGTAIFGERPR